MKRKPRPIPPGATRPRPARRGARALAFRMLVAVFPRLRRARAANDPDA